MDRNETAAFIGGIMATISVALIVFIIMSGGYSLGWRDARTKFAPPAIRAIQ